MEKPTRLDQTGFQRGGRDDCGAKPHPRVWQVIPVQFPANGPNEKKQLIHGGFFFL